MYLSPNNRVPLNTALTFPPHAAYMEGEECNTNLALGIGGGGGGGGGCGDQKPLVTSSGGGHGGRPLVKKPRPVQLHVLFPKEEAKEAAPTGATDQERRQYSVGGGCLSRSRSRSRSMDDEDEDEVEAAGAGGRTQSSGGGARKKLKLSKEQVTLLEDSFREQNILNPLQKQELAERLQIQPRQVEVWFQNRRARTKLKQTEVDCEYLKKRCDSLSSENRRLKRELQELEAVAAGRPGSPLYTHLLKAAKLTMCPSCERIAPAAGPGRNIGKAAGGFNDRLLSVNSRILSL